MRTFDDKDELEIARAFVEVTKIGENIDTYYNSSVYELERQAKALQLEKIRHVLLLLYFKKTSTVLMAGS